MSKTVIHYEIVENKFILEEMRGNCLDLIAILAIIAAKLESQVPEEAREHFRTDLLKAMNRARKEMLDDNNG